MTKQRVRIERLEIRLKGIAPETARAAVNGLGQNLLAQLSSPNNAVTAKRTVSIQSLEPDVLRVAAGASPHVLRNAIGETIAHSIRGKLK
jgi:hypothetical protein